MSEKAETSSNAIEHVMVKLRLEGERDEALAAKNRAHAFLRNVATDLEEGSDPNWVADNIHCALGEGRPNGTSEEQDD